MNLVACSVCGLFVVFFFSLFFSRFVSEVLVDRGRESWCGAVGGAATGGRVREGVTRRERGSGQPWQCGLRMWAFWPWMCTSRRVSYARCYNRAPGGVGLG